MAMESFGLKKDLIKSSDFMIQTMTNNLNNDDVSTVIMGPDSSNHL